MSQPRNLLLVSIIGFSCLVFAALSFSPSYTMISPVFGEIGDPPDPNCPDFFPNPRSMGTNCEELLGCNSSNEGCDICDDKNNNGIPDGCEDWYLPWCLAQGGSCEDCGGPQSACDCIQLGDCEACETAGLPCPNDPNYCVDNPQDCENCPGTTWCDDCDNNGVPDGADIESGGASDCNGDGIPDSCQGGGGEGGAPCDCDNDGTPDSAEDDCDGDGIPNDCETGFAAEDCDGNGTPDACEVVLDPDDPDQWPPPSTDCNGNGTPDDCEDDEDDDCVAPDVSGAGGECEAVHITYPCTHGLRARHCTGYTGPLPDPEHPNPGNCDRCTYEDEETGWTYYLYYNCSEVGTYMFLFENGECVNSGMFVESCTPPSIRPVELPSTRTASPCEFCLEAEHCTDEPSVWEVEPLDPSGSVLTYTATVVEELPSHYFLHRICLSGWENWRRIKVRARDGRDDAENCWSAWQTITLCTEFEDFKVEPPDDNGDIRASVKHCRNMTWEIPSNEAECPDPSASLGGANEYIATIRPCDGTGVITLRAVDAVDPNCTWDKSVKIACRTCAESGDCSGGAGSAANGSVDFEINLGKATNGHPAGLLWLYAKETSASLATPASLDYTWVNEEVEVTRTSVDSLRQLVSPDVFVDLVVTSSRSYEARVYYADQAGDLVADGTDPELLVHEPEGDPFLVWQIENPNSTHSNELMIRRIVGTTVEAEYQYLRLSTGTRDWQLQKRSVSGSTTTVEQTESVLWNSSSTVRTRLVKDATNATIKHVERTYDGDMRVQEVEDPSGANLLTKWTHYGSTSATPKRLRSTEYPDGSWTWLAHDAHGRTTTVARSCGDYTLDLSEDDPDLSECEHSAYTFSATDSTDFRPVTITEFYNNIAVGFTRLTYDTDSTYGLPRTITERCVNPLAGSGSQVFLTSKTVYLSLTDRRPVYVESPDGTTQLYTYEVGNYTESIPPGTDPFTVSSGGAYLRVTTVSGTTSHPNGISGKSTRDRTVSLAATGRVAYSETSVCTSESGSGSYARISWTVQQYDERGRLTNTYGSDNTHASNTWSSCCGLTSTVDATGVETTYTRDLLGRTTRQTKMGISSTSEYAAQTDSYTRYEYSVASSLNVTKTYVGSGSTESLISTEVADKSGRTISVTDQAELTTEFDYAISAEGGRIVTVTRPGGATEITEHYRDGRIKQVTGTGVIHRAYQYGIDSSTGLRWTKAFVGSDLTSSPRWVKTYSDALGRTHSEERPAFDSTDPIRTVYTYDATTGRLVSVQPFHGTTALRGPNIYEYDELGTVVQSGLDLSSPSNSVLDDASNDRITETVSTIVQPGGSGDWWRQTERYTFATAGSGTKTLIAKELTRLTGLATNVIAESKSYDVYDNVTVNTTTVDRTAKLVTEKTDYPFAGDATSISRNGLLQKTTDLAGLTTKFGYDAFGRRTSVTDPRNHETTTAYNSLGQVESVTDEENDLTTTYEYSATNGRLKAIKNPADKYTRFGYDARGNVTRTWGDVPYPTESEYDDFGQRTSLRTFRIGETWDSTEWPNPYPANGDETTWTYDEATGLVTQKNYADENGPTYDYTPEGALETRQWARTVGSSRVTTTYAYSTTTGELTGISYNDSTPSVTLTYDRRGQVASVADAAGTRSFTHEPDDTQSKETFDSGALSGKVITSKYSDTITIPVPPGTALPKMRRLSQIQVGTSSSPQTDYNATYDYDEATDRMTKVTGPGLPTQGANYLYASNTPFVSEIQYKSTVSSVSGKVLRTFNSTRDLLTVVENKWPASTQVSRYEYGYDALGRRTSLAYAGSPYTTGTQDNWGYDDRNELTSSDRYSGSPQVLDSTKSHAYEYDPIGNRTSHTDGSTTNTYEANELNEYESIRQNGFGVSPIHDLDGNLSEFMVGGDIDGDGDVDLSDLNLLYSGIGAGSTCANPSPLTAADFARADFNADCVLNLLDIGAVFSAFGQTASLTVRRHYVWDAENRLICAEPVAPASSGDKKVEYSYDYRGRRIERRVYTWNPTGGSGGTGAWNNTPSEHSRYVWFGWLNLLELDALASNAYLRKQTWGLDLAGQNGSVNSLDAAGGIGGLLAVRDTVTTSSSTDDKSYIYFYDGNGNVREVIDSGTNAVAAHYEYDPYGAVAAATGSYAATNAWRFSTKQFDPDTGLGYWGYRWYDARLGRWTARDPLGEADGPSIIAFVANAPATSVDRLGLFECKNVGSISTWFLLKGAENDRYIYTCGCGWIDREHVRDWHKAFGIIKKAYESAPTSVHGVVELFLTYKQSAYVLPLSAERRYIVDKSRASNMGLSVDDVVASIAYDLSYEAESNQNLLLQGFSCEDLPSNWIGIQMARAGVTAFSENAARPWLERTCGNALEKSEARCHCERSTMKSTIAAAGSVPRCLASPAPARCSKTSTPSIFETSPYRPTAGVITDFVISRVSEYLPDGPRDPIIVNPGHSDDAK